MKICSACKVGKPPDQFYNWARAKDGKTSACKRCLDIRKAAYLKRPEKRTRILQWRNASRATNNVTSPKITLRAALYSARRRRPGNVADIDQILALWDAQGGRCAITGIKMTWGKRRVLATSVSIDRIDQTGGYDIDNIRLVCYQVNSFRNKWSDDEMFEMALAIVTNMRRPILRVVS